MQAKSIILNNRERYRAINFVYLISIITLIMIAWSVGSQSAETSRVTSNEILEPSLQAKADTANPYLYIISQSGRIKTSFPDTEKCERLAFYDVKKTGRNSIINTENRAILRKTSFSNAFSVQL